MFKLLQKLLFVTLASIAFAGLPAGVVLADSQADICAGIKEVTGNDCDQTKAESSVQTTATTIINILSIFAGAIAVIMLIIGGFRYVTSAGNQDTVNGAKRTILYALIGLVIVAISQVVVHFVLDNTEKAVSGGGGSSASQGVCTPSPYGNYWVGGPNNGKPC